MIKYAVQVLMNKEWLWVTVPVEGQDSSQRVLVTFETQEQAEQEAKKYNKSKIVRLEDEI